MTQKFGRNFRITIDPKDGKPPILITMPFTIRFWLQRMALADLNTMSLDIYNLSKANRDRIYQDQWIPGIDPTLQTDTVPGRTITVELGYQNLYRVFTGVIQEASTAREGTELITRIEALDGRFSIANTQTYQTLESGQSIANVLQALINEFSPNLTLGAIGDFPTVLNRSVTLNGPTWDLLEKYSDNNVYIDNGKIYVLRDNEVLSGQISTINDSTGLLETPRRADGQLIVTSLLEPSIEMFTQVNIQSSVNTLYNGQYRVSGVRHEGTISGAVGGRCTTTLTLIAAQKFGGFKSVAGQ